ncbi:MAG: hypothetical protein GY929_02335 [Actinomycetia bacterium]|nr:hypothetical protein [Actinomycetes bacterium]
MTDLSDLDIVRALLATAGIHPSEPELAALAGAYPEVRAQVEGFYAVDTSDEAPASMLRAAAIDGGSPA